MKARNLASLLLCGSLLASCEAPVLNSGSPALSGGGSGAGGSAGVGWTTSGGAPSGLSYPSSPLNVFVGEDLAPILPSLASGSADYFTVSPSLPVGLYLDSRSGAISGLAPVAATSASSSYTVTARNGSGSTTASVDIAVQSQFAAYMPSLLYPRYWSAFGVLADGRLLVAGGLKTGGAADTEILDPVAGTTSAGPLLLAKRYWVGNFVAPRVATGTRAGQILIACGTAWSGPSTAATEFFDPANPGAMTAGPPMTAARPSGATATVLASGKILFVGGDSTNYANPTAELYDPATDSFAPTTGAPLRSRQFHTATLLADGRVLIAGGYAPIAPNYTSWTTVSDCEIYDPSTDSFSATGTMASPRAWGSATRLADGRVLVVGGDSYSGGNPDIAEIWDPATGGFTQTGRLKHFRKYHSAILLPDGRVVVAGGVDPYYSMASAEVYDPATGLFRQLGNLAAKRSEAFALPVGSSGTFLLIGGHLPDATYPSLPFEPSVERYK